MRTTLDIDDDVLEIVKDLAKAQRATAGEILSKLAREALTRSALPHDEPRYRNGFRLLPPTDQVITSDMVKRWLDEDV